MPHPRSNPRNFFALVWPLALGLVLLVEPMAQDPLFFDFAKSGQVFAVPHAWNVLSNLAFILVGIAGIKRMARFGIGRHTLLETTFYGGILLTGLGSSYFHWNPHMESLLWDRLPMTMAFMAFYLAMMSRCFRITTPRAWLPFALGVGAWSVLHWAQTEAAGQGDLRFYAVVQFLPLVLIPIMLLGWPPEKGKPIWCMLGFYVLAKVCEHFDHELAAWLPLELTGHALKHLFAASGAACFLLAPPKVLRPSGSNS